MGCKAEYIGILVTSSTHLDERNSSLEILLTDKNALERKSVSQFSNLESKN